MPELATALGAEDGARVHAVLRAAEHATKLLESLPRDADVEPAGNDKWRGRRSSMSRRSGASARGGRDTGDGDERQAGASDELQSAVAACATVAKSAAVALQLAAKAGAAASLLQLDHPATQRLASMVACQLSPGAAADIRGDTTTDESATAGLEQ